MKSHLKTMITVTAFSALTLTSYATATLAGQAQAQAKMVSRQAPMQRIHKAQRQHRPLRRLVEIVRVKRLTPAHREHQKWNLGLRQNKNLSATDARTITKAALLMEGKKQWHVGEVHAKKTKYGNTVYIVQIKNPKQPRVKMVALNSATGRIHPLRPI